MQRTLFLVLVAVIAVLSFEFDPRVIQKHAAQTKQTKRADTCVDLYSTDIPDYKCEKLNEKCYETVITPACQSCVDAFNNCTSYEGTSCKCFSDFVRCGAQNNLQETACSPKSYYYTCQNYAAERNWTNCDCGAYTGNEPILACSLDNYCDNSTKVCQTKKAAGSSCSYRYECGQGIFDNSMDCINKTCTYNLYDDQSIGDPCYKDADCRYGNCTNGICRGLPINAYCGYSGCTFFPCKEYDCDMGLYCNQSSVCTALLPENADCSQDSNACQMPFECSAGKCSKLTGVSLGGSCNNVDQYCRSNGACVNGVCTDVLHTKCSVNTDCAAGMYQGCTCKSTLVPTQFCIPNENLPIFYCYEQLMNFQACLGRYNCSSENDWSDYPSCGSVNCEAESKCVAKCYLTGGGIAVGAGLESCYPSFGSCPGDSVGMATSVAVSGMLMAALLFLVL